MLAVLPGDVLVSGDTELLGCMLSGVGVAELSTERVGVLVGVLVDDSTENDGLGEVVVMPGRFDGVVGWPGVVEPPISAAFRCIAWSMLATALQPDKTTVLSVAINA